MTDTSVVQGQEIKHVGEKTSYDFNLNGDMIPTEIKGLKEFAVCDKDGLPRYHKMELSFPLSLTKYQVRKILKEEKPHELYEEETLLEKQMDVRTSYNGSIDENGNIVAYMWRAAFDGFAHVSGKVLEVNITKPKMVEQVLAQERQRIAVEVFQYEEARRQKERIESIYNQLF